MLALMGTLPFITTLWLLLVLGAASLEESGSKIAAALKGRPVQQPSTKAVGRYRTQKSLRTTGRVPARLRAAA